MSTQYNQCQIEYMLANGATSSEKGVCTHQFLVAQGAAEADIGSMWLEYLASYFGHDGDRTSMEGQFWFEKGCRSYGAYPKSIIKGYTDGLNCDDSGDVVVQFPKVVTFTEYPSGSTGELTQNGVTIAVGETVQYAVDPLLDTDVGKNQADTATTWGTAGTGAIISGGQATLPASASWVFSLFMSQANSGIGATDTYTVIVDIADIGVTGKLRAYIDDINQIGADMIIAGVHTLTWTGTPLSSNFTIYNEDKALNASIVIINSISIKTGSGKTYSITGAIGTDTNEVAYEGSWDVALESGDEPYWDYAISGDYRYLTGGSDVEYVSNGGFLNGSTGWTLLNPLGDVTYDASAGNMYINRNSSATLPAISETLTVPAGTYDLSYDLTEISYSRYSVILDGVTIVDKLVLFTQSYLHENLTIGENAELIIQLNGSTTSESRIDNISLLSSTVVSTPVKAQTLLLENCADVTGRILNFFKMDETSGDIVTATSGLVVKPSASSQGDYHIGFSTPNAVDIKISSATPPFAGSLPTLDGGKAWIWMLINKMPDTDVADVGFGAASTNSRIEAAPTWTSIKGVGGTGSLGWLDMTGIGETITRNTTKRLLVLFDPNGDVRIGTADFGSPVVLSENIYDPALCGVVTEFTQVLGWAVPAIGLYHTCYGTQMVEFDHGLPADVVDQANAVMTEWENANMIEYPLL